MLATLMGERLPRQDFGRLLIGTIFQVTPQIKANCMMVQLRGKHGRGSREPQYYDWMQLCQRGPEQPPDRSNQCRGLVGLRLDPIMLS